MMRTLPVLLGFALLLGTALVHGLWTDRWSASQELEEAVARLEQVPLPLGDWKVEPLDVDSRQLERAGIAAGWRRRYASPAVSPTFSVLLMCGRFGPISVHTPEVCFSGVGYEMMGQPKRISVAAVGGGPGAEFFAATFQKQGSVVPERLRIYWSWTIAGDWEAPDHPRVKFRRSAALYKLYVVEENAKGDGRLEEAPSIAFIQQLLPKLEQTLFP